MTEKFDAKVYEFPDLFSISAPASWEPKFDYDDVLVFQYDDPSHDRMTTMTIRFFETPDAVADSMPAAIRLVIQYAEDVNWQIEEDDVAKFFTDADRSAVATITKMARKTVSGEQLPRPVLWQVWIVMGNRRFAAINHRIDDPFDGEDTWWIGHTVVRSFRWNEG